METNVLCLSAGNRKNQVEIKDGFVQPKSAQSGCTGQCPVRQAGSGELATLGKELTAYDYNSPDYPVSQRSAAQSACDAWPSQRSERGTGQCLVRQRLQITNGRLRQNRKEIRTGQCPVVHRTVRCASRQKARNAFLECTQRLLAALGL